MTRRATGVVAAVAASVMSIVYFADVGPQVGEVTFALLLAAAILLLGYSWPVVVGLLLAIGAVGAPLLTIVLLSETEPSGSDQSGAPCDPSCGFGVADSLLLVAVPATLLVLLGAGLRRLVVLGAHRHRR